MGFDAMIADLYTDNGKGQGLLLGLPQVLPRGRRFLCMKDACAW